MKIIVDQFFETNGYIKDLSKNLESSGFSVLVREYIPFLNENIPLLQDFKQGDDVFVYGTIGFVEQAIKKHNHVIAFYSKTIFDCSHYLGLAKENAHLFLNHDSILIPYGLFKNNFNQYFKLFNKKELFIRPNSGRKIFTGFVVTPDNIYHEMNSLDKLTGIRDSTLVLISTVKDIKKEYRTVIVGDQVVGFCQYMESGELSMSDIVPKEAIQIANQYAQLGETHKVDNYLVCDVAELRDGTFKIIELNALSTSDLYQINPNVLYLAAKHYTQTLKEF